MNFPSVITQSHESTTISNKTLNDILEIIQKENVRCLLSFDGMPYFLNVENMYPKLVSMTHSNYAGASSKM